MYHYINFFNETDAVLAGHMNVYATLMSMELVLMIFTSAIVMVIIYLNIVTELYHRNMRLIFSFYISTYLNHNVGNAAQLLLVVHGAVLILPAFICERLCATYFLNDYEVKQRPWVGRLIILVNAFSAIGVGLLFQSERPIRYFVFRLRHSQCIGTHHENKTDKPLIVQSVSVISMIVIPLLPNGQSEYSLGERFQISENLKAAQIWSKVGMSIAFFNVVCTSALLVDDFPFSPCVKNIAVVVFNYCIHW